jgi:hypothetical protein
MLLDNLDSYFVKASRNLSAYVDAYADALMLDIERPAFEGIKLPNVRARPTRVRRSFEQVDRLLPACQHALEELAQMESLSRKGQGSLSSPELFLLRNEGIYLLDGYTGKTNDNLGAFIPAQCATLDMTYGMPGRMSILHRHFDSIAANKTKKRQHDPLATRSLSILQRLVELPYDQVTSGPGTPYLWQHIVGFGRKDQMRFDWHMTIDSDGQVYHCYTPSTQTSMLRAKQASTVGHKKMSRWVTVPAHGFKKYDQWPEWSNGENDKTTNYVPMRWFINGMLTIWQKRFFFPTLRVEDEHGRAIVASIAEEDIPRLLKDRDVDGARKAALMHWVTSHRRIDGAAVRTHLRGDTSCTINKLKVRVLMPGHYTEAPSVATARKIDVMHKGFDLSVKHVPTTANKMLARLFNSAGLSYRTKAQQADDWKKEITDPITMKTLKQHTY